MRSAIVHFVLASGAFALGTGFSTPSFAEPNDPPAAGLVFAVKAGTQLIHQSGGAPPLCCGERDEWTAFGPSVAGQIGWNFGEHFRMSAEPHYAFLVAGDTFKHRDLALHALHLQVAAEGISSSGLRGGAVAGFGGLFGSITDPSSRTTTSRLPRERLPVMLRVGWDSSVLTGFSLGVEAAGGIDFSGFMPIGSAMLVGVWR
jgi:hypothetical protein